jgi:hypothetical protein
MTKIIIYKNYIYIKIYISINSLLEDTEEVFDNCLMQTVTTAEKLIKHGTELCLFYFIPAKKDKRSRSYSDSKINYSNSEKQDNDGWELLQIRLA